MGWTANQNANGLVVNGNNVTFYGLFVEHCQEYQTMWNGNGGRVYFYQSEMPYDPPSVEAWRHGTINGFASYKVADSVTSHEAWGLGVYCVFYAAPIVAENAIETPADGGHQNAPFGDHPAGRRPARQRHQSRDQREGQSGDHHDEGNVGLEGVRCETEFFLESRRAGRITEFSISASHTQPPSPALS